MRRLAALLTLALLPSCAHAGPIAPKVLDGLDNALRCSSSLLSGSQPSTADYVSTGACFASWVLGEVRESASQEQLAELGHACESAAKAKIAYDADPTEERAEAAAAEHERAVETARALRE